MLAGSIGLFALLLGCADGGTLGLLLAAVVLAASAATRGRAVKGSRPETDLRSARTVSSQRPPTAPEDRANLEARAPSVPGGDSLDAGHDGNGASNRPTRAWPSRSPMSPDRPTARAGRPTKDRVPRARDALPARLRFDVLQRDGFRCAYCGRSGGAPGVVLHVDHVVPLVAGGATTVDNLVTACEECNLGKATRSLVGIGS